MLLVSRTPRKLENNSTFAHQTLFCADFAGGLIYDHVSGLYLTNPGGVGYKKDAVVSTYDGTKAGRIPFKLCTQSNAVIIARIRATSAQAATPGCAFGLFASSGTQSGIGIGFDTSNNVGAATLNTNGAYLSAYSSGQLNTWYTVAVYWDYFLASVKAYVNGAPATSGQGSALSIQTTSDEIVFGAQHRSAGYLRYFKGDIEWAAIIAMPYSDFTDGVAMDLYRSGYPFFTPCRRWFAINTNSSTLRVPFKTSAGADDNIYLTTDNTLRFNNAAGYYDPIAAITV